MNKKPKFVRAMLIAGIVVVLLIIGFQLTMSFYVQPLLKSKLEKSITDGSDGLYHCTIGKLDLNIWRGRVAVKDFVIHADSVRYRELKELHALPDMTFEFNLSKGVFKGIKILKLLTAKKIDINRVTASNASLEITQNYEINSNENGPIDPWERIKSHLNGIYIDELLLDSIKFAFHSDAANVVQWSYETCEAKFQDIRIDKEAVKDTTRLLYAANIAIAFKGIQLQTADAMYRMKIDTLTYTSSNGNMDIKEFRFLPALDRKEFYKRAGYAIDQYAFEIPELKLYALQLPLLLNHKELYADSMHLKDPEINIFKDLTKSPDTVDKTGQYPHQALLDAPIKIKVPDVSMTDGKLTYTEKSILTGLNGKVTFHHINGNIKNITNRPEDIQQNRYCTVTLDGYFLKKSRLNTVFTFDLASKKGHFTADATMKNLEGEQLNVFTEALAKIRVKSFSLVSMHAFMEGDQHGATGRLQMAYHNFQVEVLKQKEQREELKGRSFLSFLANKLILYPDNPMKNKEERMANYVTAQRAPEQSFFGLIWRTLFEGIRVISVRKGAQNLKIGEE